MLALKKATIKGPSKLGKSLFDGCQALEEVKLNDNITKIPDFAFGGCSSLQKLTLPSKLKTIGTYAFYGAFQDAQKHPTLELPQTVTSVGQYAFRNTDFEEIVVPSGLRKIETGAFDANGLKRVKLPEGVEEVEEGAFGSTTTGSIYLPKSIKRVGNDAFGRYASCYVYYAGSEADWKKVPVEGGGQDGSHAWEESWIFYDVTPEQYESVWNVSHTNEIIWEFGKTQRECRWAAMIKPDRRLREMWYSRIRSKS